MEEIIQTVADKTGLSPDQAKSAIIAVVDHLKDKLPWGLGEKVESFLNNGSSAGGTEEGTPSTGEDIFNELKDKVSGFFS